MTYLVCSRKNIFQVLRRLARACPKWSKFSRCKFWNNEENLWKVKAKSIDRFRNYLKFQCSFNHTCIHQWQLIECSWAAARQRFRKGGSGPVYYLMKLAVRYAIIFMHDIKLHKYKIYTDYHQSQPLDDIYRSVMYT